MIKVERLTACIGAEVAGVSLADASRDASLFEDIKGLLLKIVEERTGYPQDMLGLDQNLEADLGIDSIKRVEIVGALTKALPKAILESHPDAAEALNQQKTLQGMLDSGVVPVVAIISR